MTSPTRFDLVALALVSVLLVVLRAPMLPGDRPHEYDELVYKELAQRLGETPRRYDLMGSYVLQYVNPVVYDKPLFHHPPLFPWTMHLLGPTMAIPVLSDIITLWLIGWLALRWFDLPRARLACFLYACCPIAFLCGTRLWIDEYLTMWATLAVVSMVVAVDRPSDTGFAIPGFLVGLAFLTKMPGALILFPVVTVWTMSRRPFRLAQLLYFGVPLAACGVPWVWTMWTYLHGIGYHTIATPVPTTGMMNLASHRPPWFYLGGLLLVAPVHAWSYWGSVTTRRELGAWIWSFVLFFTIFVSSNFQFRFIAPAAPALCLAAAAVIWRQSPETRRWLLPLIGGLALYGLQCGRFVAVTHPELGDVVPFIYPNVPGLF